MHSPCGWCDSEPCRTDDTLQCKACGNAAPIAEWCLRQRSLRLAHELQAAIERGRRLHPWIDSGVQLDALKDECAELVVELRRAKIDIGRAVAEAVDVVVTAIRLREGR